MLAFGSLSGRSRDLPVLRKGSPVLNPFGLPPLLGSAAVQHNEQVRRRGEWPHDVQATEARRVDRRGERFPHADPFHPAARRLLWLAHRQARVCRLVAARHAALQDRAAPPRHRAGASLFLHPWQERGRHHAVPERDGPGEHGAVRWGVPGVVRQRPPRRWRSACGARGCGCMALARGRRRVRSWRRAAASSAPIRSKRRDEALLLVLCDTANRVVAQKRAG